MTARPAARPGENAFQHLTFIFHFKMMCRNLTTMIEKSAKDKPEVRKPWCQLEEKEESITCPIEPLVWPAGHHKKITENNKQIWQHVKEESVYILADES
jgi:hypothetical protein